MFSQSLVALALTASAFATIFTTSPTASTSFAAGQDSTVRWREDGVGPTLADFGPSRVAVYIGGQQQQTMLQEISASIDVSQETEITFKPDAGVGADSEHYFIRFDSLSLRNPDDPNNFATAFSAKFRMTGMTGQFSKEIEDQIAGNIANPPGGSPPGGSPPATSPSAPATGSKTESPAADSKPTTDETENLEENAAAGLRATSGLVMAGAALVAVLAFF